MSTKFQLYEMRRGVEVEDGDGYTTMWMYLMLLNCTPKNGENGKFYVMCILPQLKCKQKQDYVTKIFTSCA